MGADLEAYQHGADNGTAATDRTVREVAAENEAKFGTCGGKARTSGSCIGGYKFVSRNKIERF